MPINYSDVLSRNIRMREAQREKLNKEMGHKMFQTTPLAMQLGGYVKDVVTGQIAKRGMENFADLNQRAWESGKGTEEQQRLFMEQLGGMAGMVAFHGTPHKFNKFKMSKIGTGEGAQAYGHGLYFAENPKVAGQYRDALSGNRLDSNVFSGDYDKLDEATRSVIRQNDGNIKNSIKQLEATAKDSPITGIRNLSKQRAETLKTHAQNIGYNPKGSLYEVDIPDKHIKNFLDWDAPLSEQPESVKAGLKEMIPPESWDKMQNWTGGSFYQRWRGVNQDVGMSEDLNKLGIKGIKYFDGSSRAGKEGTRNLVVFDDKIIKMLSRK